MDRKASVSSNADAALARMGYQSELPRRLSMMSILGLSFAIMAVPFGLSTTFYITLLVLLLPSSVTASCIGILSRQF